MSCAHSFSDEEFCVSSDPLVFGLSLMSYAQFSVSSKAHASFSAAQFALCHIPQTHSTSLSLICDGAFLKAASFLLRTMPHTSSSLVGGACPLLHASRTHTSLDGIACTSIS